MLELVPFFATTWLQGHCAVSCSKLDFGSEVEVMRYAVVIEDAGGNLSAYVPDLPGCVATGRTVAETASAFVAPGGPSAHSGSRFSGASQNVSQLPT